MKSYFSKSVVFFVVLQSISAFAWGNNFKIEITNLTNSNVNLTGTDQFGNNLVSDLNLATPVEPQYASTGGTMTYACGTITISGENNNSCSINMNCGNDSLSIISQQGLSCEVQNDDINHSVTVGIAHSLLQ